MFVLPSGRLERVVLIVLVLGLVVLLAAGCSAVGLVDDLGGGGGGGPGGLPWWAWLIIGFATGALLF